MSGSGRFIPRRVPAVEDQPPVHGTRGSAVFAGAGDVDMATMKLNQRAGDGQAEPKTVVPGLRRRSLLEPFEDTGEHLGRDAAAGVADDDLHTAATGGHPDVHRPT